jgi:hypothetical protein
MSKSLSFKEVVERLGPTKGNFPGQRLSFVEGTLKNSKIDDPILLTRYLRDRGGLGLSDAFAITNRLLAREAVSVEFTMGERASLEAGLRGLGVEANLREAECSTSGNMPGASNLFVVSNYDLEAIVRLLRPGHPAVFNLGMTISSTLVTPALANNSWVIAKTNAERRASD